MAGQPRIVTRREWGAAFTIPGNRRVAPSARRFFVVHWPGSGVGPDERAAVRGIERFHRSNLGWAAAPGYNYLVGQSGTIYEGCGRDVRGIHSPPRNVDGWGVCMLVPVNGRSTEACRRSTAALYTWLCSVAGRQLGRRPHNQDFATACPGPELTAWVRSGMPGGGPAPPPQPPSTEEVEMIASAVAANGAFHVWVVGPQRRTAWFTVQSPGSTSWGGGRAGQQIAGLSRFWDAPQGRTIRGVTAERSQGGVLHFWATLDDGSTFYAFQRANESEWRGGSGGSRLGRFAPRP